MKCEYVEMEGEKEVHCQEKAYSYLRGGYVQMGQRKPAFCREHCQLLLSPQVAARGRVWEWDLSVEEVERAEKRKKPSSKVVGKVPE